MSTTSHLTHNSRSSTTSTTNSNPPSPRPKVNFSDSSTLQPSNAHFAASPTTTESPQSLISHPTHPPSNPTPTSVSLSKSHSNSASNSSSQPLTSRSASSFSTFYSDPFLHADDLDATYQWIPSFYLEDRDVEEGSPVERVSRLSFGCRGLNTPSSAYSRDTDTEGATEEAREEAKVVRKAQKGLQKVVEESGLEDELKERFLAVGRMVWFISAQLFPPSHVLREDVRKDVQGILEDMEEFLDQVIEKIALRVEAAKLAMDRVPTDDKEDQGLEVRIREWVGALEFLHAPTGAETLIFRNLSILYSTLIYTPFLQLHRSEPTHNIYALDPHISSVSSKLKKAELEARKADLLVLQTEKAFEEKMMGERKEKGHVVSVSAPVLGASVLRRQRQRENTV